MQVLSATFASLLDTSETFSSTGRDMDDTLSALSSGLTAMRTHWIGEASSAFDTHYTGWFAAAEDLRSTVSELSALLDTVHGNYHEATSTTATLWGATGPRPDGGFQITLDDLRITAKAFADLQHRLLTAMQLANASLAGTAGMAGLDHVLARWRDRYDPMTWAVARAVRSVSVVLGVVAQKLTDTANAYIDAENASTPGSPALDRLPAPDVRFDPTGIVPPLSSGQTGELIPAELAEYWPNADTARLRAAADAWHTLHEELIDINNSAIAAFRALFDANAGATFSLMRGYWDMLCRHEAPVPCNSDPGAGLKPFNLVSHMTAQLATSCHELAALVDDTRRNMAVAAKEAADDDIMKLFAWIAAILDAWRTAGVSETVVEIGKATLLGGYLDAERDTYLGHLTQLAGKLLPQDRERLDLFSDTHDTTQEVLPSLTEAADVITGDLRGKWHELTGDHPTPDQINLTQDRRTHILDGDGTGGGHRAGSPNNSSHFPPNWTDDKIIQEILSVARNPETIEPNLRGRWKAVGVRDGVLIEVIVNPDGTIRTAWPVLGPGVRPRQ